MRFLELVSRESCESLKIVSTNHQDDSHSAVTCHVSRKLIHLLEKYCISSIQLRGNIGYLLFSEYEVLKSSFPALAPFDGTYILIDSEAFLSPKTTDSFIKELSHLLHLSWSYGYVSDDSVFPLHSRHDNSCSQLKLLLRNNVNVDALSHISEAMGFTSTQYELLQQLLTVYLKSWFAFVMTVNISQNLSTIKRGSAIRQLIHSEFSLLLEHSNTSINSSLSSNLFDSISSGPRRMNISYHTIRHGDSDKDDQSTETSCSNLLLRKRSTARNSIEFHVHIELNSTCALSEFHIIEPLSLAYDVYLHSFQYSLYQSSTQSNPSTWSFMNSGFVTDLVSFQIQSNANCDDSSDGCTRAISFDFSHLSVPGSDHQYLVILDYDAKTIFPRSSYIPPDASYGVLIQPSIVQVKEIIYFSDTALVSRAIPDSSMPYNVVTLVSTILAFIVGSFINSWSRKSK